MPGQPREALKASWESWLKEHMDSGGSVPVGNLPDGQPNADPRWRGKPRAKAPLNLGGVRGITNEAEAQQAVSKAVKNSPIVLFMKGSPAMPQCGFSARSVGILQELGVEFDAVDVMDFDNNPGVREAIKAYSGWPTIPQLFVGGELIGGADIITEMHGTGELGPRLANPSEGAKEAAGAEAKDFTGEVLLVSDNSRPTATALSTTINEAFDLKAFRLMDETAQHHGDPGAMEMGLTGESHFRLEIVAPDFEGLSPVKRQKLVYDSLAEVMPKIHALALVTRTPAEAARSL